MAIPFLGEIERLITEHGSAAILKERLSLANDQYTALERNLFEAEKKSQSHERDAPAALAAMQEVRPLPDLTGPGPPQS